jgi:hypothetical protein
MQRLQGVRVMKVCDMFTLYIVRKRSSAMSGWIVSQGVGEDRWLYANEVLYVPLNERLIEHVKRHYPDSWYRKSTGMKRKRDASGRFVAR